MMRHSLFVVLLLAATLAAQDSFVFRDGDRPEYRQRISVDELRVLRDTTPVTLLDVRLIEDFESDPQLIPGADYRNPESIMTWFADVPKDRPVVVYCVRGKWVSQKAAHVLSSAGYDVYSLDGGIEAWNSAKSE